MLQAILEHLWWVLCRHEWVRDRDEAGQLINRCMRCGGIKDDPMTLLVRWRPDYDRIEPSRVTELAVPMDRQPSANGYRANWHPSSYRAQGSGRRSAA